MAKCSVTLDDNDQLRMYKWMIKKLPTSINGTYVYAVIFRDSVDEGDIYTRGIDYIRAWAQLSKETVSKYLKDLTEKGLIIKKEYYDQGRKFTGYCATDAWKKLEEEHEKEEAERRKDPKYKEYYEMEDQMMEGMRRIEEDYNRRKMQAASKI